MNKSTVTFCFQFIALVIMTPIMIVPDWVILACFLSLSWYPIFFWISSYAKQIARRDMEDFYLQDGEQVVSDRALKRSRDRYRKALKREMKKAREVLKDAN